MQQEWQQTLQVVGVAEAVVHFLGARGGERHDGNALIGVCLILWLGLASRFVVW